MHSLHQLYRILSLQPQGDDIQLTAITADSRQVMEGGVFVAEKGVNVDGHDYIPKALAAGAKVVVCERIPDNADRYPDTIWVKVDDTVQSLGRLADWWYGSPSRHLRLVGVTGTNGKTTIATLLYEMAKGMGLKAGLISTVENRINNTSIPATHTTPDTLTLHRLMRNMVDEGCKFCAMEVSSHACHQRRIAGLKFAGGIFTNLTRDHLDYHKTVQEYLKAKKSFFDSLDADAFALTNADDRNGSVMLQNTRARKYTYSIQSDADFRGRVVESRLDGMTMMMDGTEVETAFVGRFNAANLTAVYAASILIGWERAEVLRNISLLHPVSGRMQTIHSTTGITAVVDYAHTPDALVNVLDTIREMARGARIITVAGAGGDRDKGKRPIMAAEAARRSDVLIITSDNPRHEDASVIASEMIAGIPPEAKAEVVCILDRRQAIVRAVAMAKKGDVVLIAGKGHETYQIIGDVKHHFDDREVVKAAFGL